MPPSTNPTPPGRASKLTEAVDADLRHAEQAEAAGDEETALRLGAELATTSQRLALPADRQAALFVLLGRLTSGIDAGDCVTVCLAMAERCRAEDGLLHAAAATACTRLRLLQWLWSDPAFESLLNRPALDASRRELLLSRLLQDAMGLRSPWWEPVVMGLLERDPQGVRHALAALPAGATLDEQADAAYAVAAALLTLGDAAGAHAIRSQTTLAWPGSGSQRARAALHLDALLAAARGELNLALALYRDYAMQAAQHIGKLHPTMRGLLKSLTALPPSKPRDLLDVRPVYLEEALALMNSGEAPPGVASLARRVGVSERTLREAFRTHLRTTPKDHALTLRLDAARRFVDSGMAAGMPVSELALRFGFGHAGRFSSLYRKRFGRSPAAPSSGTPG